MPTTIWTLFFAHLAGYFLYQCWKRWRLIRTGRTDDGRNYSPSTYGTRFENTLVYALGQKKFFGKDQPAGVMHAALFFGFLILFIQIVTMFGRGWAPEFIVPGFSANLLGKPYAFIKDIFEVIVILATLIAIARWTVLKADRLLGFSPAENKIRQKSHWEAILILIFILAIMVSGLLYDAGRIVFLAGVPHIQEESLWQPVSLALAGFFTNDPRTAVMVAQVSWWVHNLVILIFLNFLPRSKHFHIITAIPNVFFGKLEPKGHLPKKEFEAEDALFGRSQINHFTQKQILDMYSCTECGRCSSVCPATSTGKPLAPRQFLLNLRDTLYEKKGSLLKKAGGEEEAPSDVVVGENKTLADDVIWSCNACRACEEACPVNIEYVDKIVDIRQHLVQEAARFPEELNRTLKGLETNSNPWGISSAERMGWAEGLDVPTVEDNPGAEYLYYVGCAGSFDAENKKSTRAFVTTLKKAGVNFAVLGQNETCNGETARRLGNEYLFQTMAEQLVSTINATGIKKLLVNCPHCYNTFKNEYPNFGGNWELIRAAELIQKLADEGKLQIGETRSDATQRVVYHDSCYYARFNDVMEEPRNLIDRIPGTKRLEMKANKKSANCCGAGGGRMWLEEDKDKRVNIMRVKEALKDSPDVIATSCPYCKIMMASAINEMGLEEKVKVKDVTEIISESAP